MKKETIVKKIEKQAARYKLRASRSPSDRKRHDQVQADEQQWMGKAHRELGWSAAKIGEVFGRDPRTVGREIKRHKPKEEARVEEIKEAQDDEGLGEEISSLQQTAKGDPLLSLIRRWQLELEAFSPVHLLQGWFHDADGQSPPLFHTSRYVEELCSKNSENHCQSLLIKPSFQVQHDPAFSLLHSRFHASCIWTALDGWSKQMAQYIKAFYQMLRKIEPLAADAVDALVAEARSEGMLGSDWINSGDSAGLIKRYRVMRILTVAVTCRVLVCSIGELPNSPCWARLGNDLRKLQLEACIQVAVLVGIAPTGGLADSCSYSRAKVPYSPLEITRGFLEELTKLQPIQDSLAESLEKLESEVSKAVEYKSPLNTVCESLQDQFCSQGPLEDSSVPST